MCWIVHFNLYSVKKINYGKTSPCGPKNIDFEDVLRFTIYLRFSDLYASHWRFSLKGKRIAIERTQCQGWQKRCSDEREIGDASHFPRDSQVPYTCVDLERIWKPIYQIAPPAGSVVSFWIEIWLIIMKPLRPTWKIKCIVVTVQVWKLTLRLSVPYKDCSFATWWKSHSIKLHLLISSNGRFQSILGLSPLLFSKDWLTV